MYPKTMVAIYENFIAGNMEKAREAQDSLRSFRNCFKFGNPNTIVKKAVQLLGYEVGLCRAPFNQVSAEGVAAVQKVLDENKEKNMW